MKQVDKKSILAVSGLIIGVGAIVMTFVWFDWRLFVVLTLWFWSNNTAAKSEQL